jgi:hypothetical protein
MIFRADWLRNSMADSTQGRQKQKDVSRRAAEAWNKLCPTLKDLYKLQAEIVKAEHKREYPEWIYKPKPAKRKSSVVDDPVASGGSPPKRVARGHTCTPSQKPSTNTKGKRGAKATPSTPLTEQTELIWDGSLLSGRSLMKDPFYSATLQPLASVSPSI